MNKMMASKKAAPKKATSSKKKSDAPAPTKASVSIDKDSSIRVRQIENGFLISQSGTKGKGKNVQYFEKEHFSKDNPIKISMPTKQPSFGKKK